MRKLTRLLAWTLPRMLPVTHSCSLTKQNLTDNSQVFRFWQSNLQGTLSRKKLDPEHNPRTLYKHKAVLSYNNDQTSTKLTSSCHTNRAIWLISIVTRLPKRRIWTVHTLIVYTSPRIKFNSASSNRFHKEMHAKNLWRETVTAIRTKTRHRHQTRLLPPLGKTDHHKSQCTTKQFIKPITLKHRATIHSIKVNSRVKDAMNRIQMIFQRIHTIVVSKTLTSSVQERQVQFSRTLHLRLIHYTTELTMRPVLHRTLSKRKTVTTVPRHEETLRTCVVAKSSTRLRIKCRLGQWVALLFTSQHRTSMNRQWRIIRSNIFHRLLVSPSSSTKHSSNK